MSRRRAVRELQLGAALPRPAHHRGASEQEPALRRGAALVPLHLRSDLNDTSVAAAAALLEVPRASGRTATSQQIDELLALLSKPDDELHADGARRSRTTILSGYEAIRNKPFQPHAVARTRHVAYQYCVVMKYLDNLIAWGDSLFRQDTIESINEATQLYVLAANILGRAAAAHPAARHRPAEDLRAAQGSDGLDAMGNALVELEGQFPFNLGLPPTQGGDPDAARAALRHRAHALLLHPAQRQAARLLGHGRRPAVQDPPLHEHRGRGAPARAVRPADRPGHAGQGGGGRDRHRQRSSAG